MAIELEWEDYETGAVGKYWMIEGIDFHKFSSRLQVRLKCYSSKDVRDREGKAIAHESFSLDINKDVLNPLFADLYNKIKNYGVIKKQLNSAENEEDIIYKDLDFSESEDV